MAEKIYNWTDDPMVSGVADCNTDVVNDCLMHLKYENTSDAIQNMYETGQVEKQTRGYNQLLEMKRSTFDKSKFTVVGSPTITDDGVASGFIQSSHIDVNTIDISTVNSWEFGFKITTGEDITVKQYCFSPKEIYKGFLIGVENGKLKLLLGNTGTSWNIHDGALISVSTNIEYYIRVGFTGSNYYFKYSTDNTTWQTALSVTSSKKVLSNSLWTIGTVSFNTAQYFKGSIDLKFFSITVDGKEAFNGNKTGIDIITINNETVEIPYTLSKTGSKIVDVAYRDKIQELYTQDGTASYYTLDETNQDFTLPMGEIYGMIERKSDMLNNPFTFGMNMYFKGEMNNLSWLQSTGGYKPKGGYPSFYNWVLTNANANKAGFKLSTASDITDYDFVVNTTNETFRLPLKNGQEGVFASGVKGNGMTIGLSCGTYGESGLASVTSANLGLTTRTTQLGTQAGFGSSSGSSWPKSIGDVNRGVGLTADPTKSGMVVDTTVPAGWNLYYYVGETVQNANLIDAGRFAEELTNKLDKSSIKAYVIQTYINGTSGYRVWSDGYVEQWGKTGFSVGGQTVTLLKPMKDTNYNVFTTIFYNGNFSTTGGNSPAHSCVAVSTTQIRISQESSASKCTYWRVYGYLAEGEY